jgi:hypothetical protein
MELKIEGRVTQNRRQTGEVHTMTKQDKAAILLGWGLNTVVMAISLFAATHYIA